MDGRKLAVALALVVAAPWALLHARTGGGSTLRLTGTFEVHEVRLAFRMAGRVAERTLSEGQSVRAGQVVARLETDEVGREAARAKAEVAAAAAALAEAEAGPRPEEVAQAEAGARRARAVLAELEAGSRPQEKAGAAAAVRALEVEVARLALALRRTERLTASKAASQEQLDNALAAHDGAQARLREARERSSLIEEGPRREQVEQARAGLAQAEAGLGLVRQGARREVRDLLRSRLDAALAVAGLAETRLGFAELTSPVTGVVLQDHVEPGEYVTPGAPVVTVTDLGKLWLRAYVPETSLGHVKVGQAVSLRTDTWPDRRFAGRVSFIASEAEFTPKSVQTEEERTRLVFRIKVDVENPDGALKPGMPADAWIEVGP